MPHGLWVHCLGSVARAGCTEAGIPAERLPIAADWMPIPANQMPITEELLFIAAQWPPAAADWLSGLKTY